MKNTLIILFFTIKLFSQSEISEKNIAELKKNIIAYHIRNNDNFNFKNVFLDCDWTLQLQIKKIDDKVLLSEDTWTFYKVINDNFTFQNINENTVLKAVSSHGPSEFRKIRSLYLIGVNDKQEIIYIGGNFYKTSIADKFNITINNYESFFSFLKYKLFNYDLTKIKLIKKRHDYILFEAYSNILTKKIKIKMNKNNFDDIVVVN